MNKLDFIYAHAMFDAGLRRVENATEGGDTTGGCGSGHPLFSVHMTASFRPRCTLGECNA